MTGPSGGAAGPVGSAGAPGAANPSAAGHVGAGDRPGFGARLARAMDEHGPLCVGVDPHAPLLAAWGLPDSADGARELGLRVVDEVAGRVAALKPQSAFFERFGPAGWAALQEVLAAATSAGLLTVLDVKRGDIGSTMAAYAAAHLGDDAPMPADAITVSPYLGPDSLTETAALAHANGRGVFALALTSNPEGAAVQHASVRGSGAGGSVAGEVARWAAARNAEARTDDDVPGHVGLVVGATTGTAVADLGLDLTGTGGILLAPGVGAQGAGAEELRAVFGPARHRVLAAVSRSVLAAGPDRGAVARAARETAGLVTSALRES
ncbi:orotidine-5'-phosphate decarboxylase [Georgenia sp. Z1344]|uniref:orotidine-5'-phosphate decarboxylase n=1 Tax=Georgenia sp. Z1344 TaxID=3416706 RepID=UPI003CF08FB8